MSRNQSIEHTTWGRFKQTYHALRRARLLERTPLVFVEGDSWFSTPLSMNIVDWLVYPSPEDLRRGVPVFGAGGLFFRAENSGDTAAEIFAEDNLKQISRWYGAFPFDVVLISAGGNDFVGQFLKDLFANVGELSVTDALQRVRDTGRYQQLVVDYRRFLDAFFDAHPDTPILGHSYAYITRIGVPADLTVANIGLIALLKDEIGDWIGKYVEHVLPDPVHQRDFANGMLDLFYAEVLLTLEDDYPNFHCLDLRECLDDVNLWYDEMHPTGEGFAVLADQFRRKIFQLLPEQKRG